MHEPGALAGDVRGRAGALIRERQHALGAAVATAVSIGGEALTPSDWRRVADLLVRLFAGAVETGSLHAHGAVLRQLTRYSPPLTTRELVDPLHVTERVILD